MNRLHRHIALLLVTILMTTAAIAQTATRSVGLHLQKAGVTLSGVNDYIDRTFGDGGTYTFEAINSYTDSYGTTHTDYQQYYRGVAVENCILIVHSEGNIVTGINGQAATAAQMEKTSATLTATQAAGKARTAMGIRAAVNPTVDKVYTRYRDAEGNERYRMAYRTHIASFADGKNVNTYIDCADGSVIKTEDLMLHANEVTEVELETLYPIVEDGEERTKRKIRMTEQTDGKYALIDEGRKIYIHEGKTNATEAPTTDAEMAQHIADISKNTPYKTSAEKDRWELYHVSDIDIDSIALHRKVGSKYVMLDTVKTNYYISICQGKKELYTNNLDNTFLNGKVPPFGLNDKFFSLETDTTYTLYIKREYKQSSSSLRNSYDTLHRQDFVATKGEKISFGSDSIFGEITVTARPNHAVDAQYAMHTSYEYYLERHGRKGFDGKETPLHVFVDFDDIYASFQKVGMNAFAWSTPPYFIATGCGDGYRKMADVYTTLDLLAHEYTHLVVMTNGRGGLKTTGETGAINEAIPDCFAVAIDMYKNGDKANWQIADGGVLIKRNNGNTMPTNMRDMSDPNMSGGNGESHGVAYPQPDTYHGEYWKNVTNLGVDAGGIHYNNGVFNYWFYLITEGSNGTNDNGDSYNVKGLGIEVTEKLLMDVVMNYMVKEATYSDMYNATRMAASDTKKYEGGVDGEVYKQVTNAWLAVGVNEVTSDVEPVVERELNVYTNGNDIMVEAEEGTEITVYSVLGQQMTSTRATAGTTVIAMPEMGSQVVIVKAGSQAKKVVL